MRSRPLGNDTITILVPTVTVDTRDNTEYLTYTDGATIRNCSLQPFLMTEKFQEEYTTERESTRTFFRVFCPVLPEILEIDQTYQIRYADEVYEVHAIPGEWRALSGRPDHIAFLLKRRVG